eukprot:264367_1
MLLKNQTVDVNKVDNLGMTPLYFAASRGNVGVTQVILGSPKTDVNCVSTASCSALMAASEGGHRGVLKLLFMKRELNLHAVNQDGKTAKMLAKNYRIISMLDAETERR